MQGKKFLIALLFCGLGMSILYGDDSKSRSAQPSAIQDDKLAQVLRKRIVDARGKLTEYKYVGEIGSESKGIQGTDPRTGRVIAVRATDFEVLAEITENGEKHEYVARDEETFQKKFPKIYDEFQRRLDDNTTSPATAEKYCDQHLIRVEELLELTEIYLNRLSRMPRSSLDLETDALAIKPIKQKLLETRAELEIAAQKIRAAYKKINAK